MLLGIGLTLLGVLSASVANILQAEPRSRQHAARQPARLGHGLRNRSPTPLLAWLLDGPPVIETRPAYWLGLVYLGLFASALAFPLYFAVMRAVGPGKAAYSSVLVPDPRDGAFDRCSKAIAGRRSPSPAA